MCLFCILIYADKIIFKTASVSPEIVPYNNTNSQITIISTNTHNIVKNHNSYTKLSMNGKLETRNVT